MVAVREQRASSARRRRESVLAGRHLQARADLFDELRGRSMVAEVQVELARLDARDVQQFVHQSPQATGLRVQ